MPAAWPRAAAAADTGGQRAGSSLDCRRQPALRSVVVDISTWHPMGGMNHHDYVSRRDRVRSENWPPAVRGDLIRPARSRLRRGAGCLQRHDRQAPGGHRALPRRRRRRRVRAVLPRARHRGRGPRRRANGAGLGTCDDGLVIDLSQMKGVRWVDPGWPAPRRWAAGVSGARWITPRIAFGRPVPVRFSSRGPAWGAASRLGGGIGYLTRQYGLSIDNLLSVDMVLADGRLRHRQRRGSTPTCSGRVRGGGGNFGVVTSFTVQAASTVSMVLWRPDVWPLEDGRRGAALTVGTSLTAPEEVGGFFAFLLVPPGPTFRSISTAGPCAASCGAAPARRTRRRRWLSPIRGGRKPPALDFGGPVPFILPCRACSTPSTVPDSSGTGGPTTSRVDRRAIALHDGAWLEAAQEALHDASVPGQRGGRPGDRMTPPPRASAKPLR